MREIKFRIWDKSNKTMYDKALVGNYPETVPVVYANYEGECGWYHIESSICEVMQYTGLKDKNGNEIFEGDIVNKIGIVSEEVFELKKDYIEINTPQLGNVLIFTDILYDRKTGYKELLVKENTNGILSETQNYEVIGNIYKNPELLEGEE